MKWVPFIVFVIFQVILVETRLNEHEMDYKMGIRILVNTFLIVFLSKSIAKPGFERCPKPAQWILLPVVMMVIIDLLFYTHEWEVILFNAGLFSLPGLLLVGLYQWGEQKRAM
jgi:hypothetical protein